MAVSGGYLGGQSGGGSSGSRFLSNAVHNERQYQHRIVQYEKEFNINITRINAEEKELRESMLAYTNRARNWRERNHVEKEVGAQHIAPLQIRARNIPKLKFLPKLETTRPVVKKESNAGADSGNTNNVKESLAKRLHKFNEESRVHAIPSLTDNPSPSPRKSKETVKLGFVSEVDLDDMRNSVSSKNATSSKRFEGSSKDPRRRPKPIQRKLHHQDESAATSVLEGPSRPQKGDTSTASVTSTRDSSSSLGGVNLEKKRAEITRRILKDAIDKLKDIENRRRDPVQLIARLKANKLRSKRLTFRRQRLDVILEDEDDARSASPRGSLHGGSQATRFSLSRERPIDQSAVKHSEDGSLPDTGEFVPDRSLFPRHRALPSLASKPAPYQQYQQYRGREERSRKLHVRAKQRQKARKLKFLKEE